MFESLWMMLGASRWWQRLTGGLAAVVDWVGASPLHVVLAALLASLAANGWQRHDRDSMVARDANALAIWSHAFATEQGAFRGEQQAAQTLGGALANQNDSIAALARAGVTRQQDARAALAAAAAHDAGDASLAARIEREEAEPAVGGGCATPEAVMAARNVL
jgi:hypothetical protein